MSDHRSGCRSSVPLPEFIYAIGTVHTVRASNRFRITFDTNRYSMPAEFASQRLLQRLVSLTARADEYYRELEQRQLNPIHHVRKMVAVSEIYGTEATARALDDAFEYGAFSSDYINRRG